MFILSLHNYYAGASDLFNTCSLTGEWCIIFAGSTAAAVTRNNYRIINGAFLSDPPTFSIQSFTSNGPPTIITWSRNGEEIRDDGYSFLSSPDSLTLFVTGRLPGVYQRSASNRATPSPIINTYNIEGNYTALSYYIEYKSTIIIVYFQASWASLYMHL